MDVQKPEWFDQWVIAIPGKWQLKSGAPEEVLQEFEEFMKQLQQYDTSDLE